MAQTEMVTTTAGRARTVPARAPARPVRARRMRLPRRMLHGAWRMGVLGVLIGVALVWLSPLVAAIAGLTVAAAGVVLSEGRLHGPDRNALMGAAGLMLVALAYLVTQLVRLL